MHAPISALAPLILVVLALSLSACDDNGATLQSGPTPRGGLQNVLVYAAPAVIAPEFLPGIGCSAFPPFRTSFNLFVRSERAVFLRRLGFELRDRSGGRALPLATVTSLAPAGQASLPLAVPTSSPVPIPGTLPFHGVEMSQPFTAGLALQFGCGVPARGTLFIEVETADRDGVPALSHLSVDVGD
jgi:hypothetical protein